MSDGDPVVVLSTTVEDTEVVVGVFGPYESEGEASEHVVVGHKGNALLCFLPLGDVVDNDNKKLCHTLLVANDNAAGREYARMADGHFDLIVAG